MYMNFYWIIVALQCCYFLLYRSESVIYACIYPLFFGFPSHLGHPIGLSKVPCTKFSLVIYVIHSSAFSCIKNTKKLGLKRVIKINIKKLGYMIKKKTTHTCVLGLMHSVTRSSDKTKNYHNFEVMISMCDILRCLLYQQCARKRSIISTANKTISTIITCCVLLPTSTIKRNDKFQLEISKNEDIVFLSRFRDSWPGAVVCKLSGFLHLF